MRVLPLPPLKKRKKEKKQEAQYHHGHLKRIINDQWDSLRWRVKLIQTLIIFGFLVILQVNEKMPICFLRCVSPDKGSWCECYVTH